MKFILNTGRTIRQGKFTENKLGQGYAEETSRCYIHPLDLLELGIEEGENIMVTNVTGEVVLVALADEGLPKGMVFVPYGIHCNSVISPCTHGTGMPDYKIHEVEIAPTSEDRKTPTELLEQLGGVRYAGN
ncbi:molybdopterin dinucleotide binding domain-containing protein [Methanogenium sp. MK-MG]|uniref:molybdopterin dinucleotide binding domain-containing protein n=1 Tax=Methanogenium sp. MK-MG TaxID=2599926 RepID=UPI0013EDB2BD|nr:molybdopterin dinucleotide binding domain-containing protein [Methanogenium sp. MK-MG]KAF1074240.1 Molybdenum-containing formylmethanofuran dehydrogenase 1 subunit C [Methanogenium sp. MK-MG]